MYFENKRTSTVSPDLAVAIAIITGLDWTITHIHTHVHTHTHIQRNLCIMDTLGPTKTVQIIKVS